MLTILVDGKSKDFKDQIHAMTWSSRTLYQVREWLKGCAESHPQCTGSRSKLDDPNRRPLPSRLLDTGPLLLHGDYMSTADMDSLSLNQTLISACVIPNRSQQTPNISLSVTDGAILLVSR